MDRRWLILVVLVVTLPVAYVVQYGWTLPSFQFKPASATPEPTEYRVERDVPYTMIQGVPGSMTSLDIYSPLKGEKHPVVVLVHSGRWDKSSQPIVDQFPAWLTRLGCVFVPINYRHPSFGFGFGPDGRGGRSMEGRGPSGGPDSPLAVDGRYPKPVEDVAAALTWISQNIGKHGGDPDRIAVLGMSTGAHFAGLAALNERFITDAGGQPGAVDAAILINGMSYDLPYAVNGGNGWYSERLKVYFGDDPATLKDASLLTHIASDRPPQPFLLIHSAYREFSGDQANRLADALRAAGGDATVFVTEGSSYGSSTTLGYAYDPATTAVEEFLNKVWPGLISEGVQ